MRNYQFHKSFHAITILFFLIMLTTKSFSQTSNYLNGFETTVGPDDWGLTGTFQAVTIVPSGTSGITSSSGLSHGIAPNLPGDGSFTRFGRIGGGAYNPIFPCSGFSTSLNIYLDVNGGYANDTRFDYSVAINKSDGNHLRDFIFAVGFYNDATSPGTGNRFVISASNNAPGWPKDPGRSPQLITTTGWYKFEHKFYNNAGVLAVDLTIYDAGNAAVASWTLSNPTDLIGTVVGGTRYGWLLNNAFSGLAIDNSALYLTPGPIVNLNTLITYCTIQSAINDPLTLNGHTISVNAGTYNERVTINKSLTIQGVNKLTTIVSGTGLAGSGSGFRINNGVTNVTIKDLTIKNFSGFGPNSDGGIYAVGGNHNLTVSNCVIKDNVGGAGIYANGPVNTVLFDGNTISGHSAVKGAARGIVIWNGLKQNITITNNEVFNNNCCGIELQDGTASGVTITGNNVHDNGDNGFGLTGLQGPGVNLVSSNTVTDNGRFGIEIKNPNGSGSNAGPGSIVISGNNVSRTFLITDNRDISGIAVFRRDAFLDNVDVPTGVVVSGNDVSGYTQPSLSEGFGIVMEGLNHLVSGNTLNGNDIGIQRQAGNLPYSGLQTHPAAAVNGDQSNIANDYFGRGNSPITCAVTLSGNIFGNIAANGINTRDVGNSSGTGIVTNTNTGKSYCTIQSAIDDVLTLNGHLISVSSGTFNEAVTVNKVLTISGAGSGPGGTIISNPGGTALTMNAGINSATRVIAQNLRLTGSATGVVVSSFNTLNNTESVSNTLYGINLSSPNDLIVTNSKFNFNGLAGLKLASTASASNISFTDCEFNNNSVHGWYADASSSIEPIFDNVLVSNTTFNNNLNKGIYTERLSNAIFNNITVNNSGTGGAANHRAGIDINLKWRTDYTNIQILNSTISNSGTGDPNGGGVLIKARSDGGTYGANPAALNNVVLSNLFVANNGGTGLYSSGIRIGEANNSITGTNGSPTNVSITGCSITGNSPYAISNVTSGTTVAATCNWYGSVIHSTVAAAINGSVNHVAWLSNGTDSAPATPGFQPAPNTCSGCPSGNVVQNINTLEYFCSIQEAINDAQTINGHTIQVGPGTYNENVIINKSVILKGANYNVSCSGSRGAESVINGVLGSNSAAVSIEADGVTLNGFKVTNHLGSFGVFAQGRNNTDVQYNVIDDVGNNVTGQYPSYGIYMLRGSTAHTTNVNFSSNCVMNIRGGENTSLTGAAAKANNGSAVGIGAGDSEANFDISGLTIDGNIIDDISACISAFADGGKGAYGVIINVGAKPANTGKAVSPLVTNNEITDLEGLWAHGVGLEGETPGAMVLNNIINGLTDHKGNTDAIGVLLESNDGASTVQIHDNSLTNMAYAVVNLMPPAVNATCNWYGTTSIATITGLIAGGPVAYVPYLVDGTDASPAVGFQPNPACTGVIPAATISFTATTTNGSTGSTVNSSPTDVTIKFCPGNFFSFSGYASNPGAHVGVLENLVSSGNVLYNGGPVPAVRPQTHIAPSGAAAFFTGPYGPYTLASGSVGTIDQTYTPYYDVNNDNQYDASTDVLGTPVVLHYIIDQNAPQLINPMTGCSSLNQSGLNQCLAAGSTFNGASLIPAVAALYQDDHSGVTVSFTGDTPGAGNSDCNWSFTYNYTIADACGNAVNCSVVYSGGDATAPVLTGTWPSNSTGNNACDPGITNAPDYATIAALYTDGCGGSITVTQSTVAGTNTNCGWSYVTTYSIKDACNNTVSPSPMYTYSGGDQTPPTVITKPAILILDAGGNATITPSQVNNGSSDDCGGPVSLSVSPTSFTCADVSHMAYKVSNYAGNQSWQGELGMKFTVAAPGIKVDQLGVFDNNGNGISGAIRVAIFSSPSTIVPGLDVTISGTSDALINGHRVRPVTPVVLPPGNYTIVAKGFNATDRNGNVGNGAPTGTTDGGGGLVTFTSNPIYGPNNPAGFAYPTINDGGPVNRYYAGTFIYVSATSNNTVSLTATDICNNSASATAVVNILDNSSPSITCPAPVTVTCASLVPSANVAAVTTSDNCSTVTVTHVSDVISGQTCPNRYTITRTYKATDLSGNISTCNQIITVNDNLAPNLITGQVIPAGGTNINACTAPVGPSAADIQALFEDNCGGAVTVTKSGTPTGNSCGWSVTYSYKVEDNCGNFTTVTVSYDGKDQTAPNLITGQVIPAGGTNINACMAPVGPSAADIQALFEDNCGGALTVTKSGTPTGNSCGWSVTYSYKVEDNCGNFTTVTVSYDGKDQTPPTFTLPADITILFSGPNTYNASPAVTGNPTAVADNCSGTVTVTYSDGTGPVQCGNSLVITRTWTATDACGNSSSQVQTITVTDNSTLYIIYAEKDVNFDEYHFIGGDVGVTAANGKADFKKNSVLDPYRITAKNIHVHLPSAVNNRTYSPATGGPTPTFYPYNGNTAGLSNINVNASGVLNGNWKDVTIKKGITVTVNGNNFGKFKIEEGAKVTFTAPVINMRELSVEKGKKNSTLTTVLFTSPTAVKVKDKVTIDDDTRVNVGGPIVTFYAGDNTGGDEKFEVKGENSQVTANIMVPVGKLHVHGGNDISRPTIMTGWYIIEKLDGHGKYVYWNKYECTPAAPRGPVFTGTDKKETPSFTRNGKFDVKVFPNPSVTDFRIQITSDSDEPVRIRIFDVSGRTLQTISNATANSYLSIGSELRQGSYFVEIQQGTNRQTVKLLKME